MQLAWFGFVKFEWKPLFIVLVPIVNADGTR